MWIGLLSGIATLTACNVVGPQPCYYGPPPTDPTEDTVQTDRKEMLRQRIAAIRDIVEERRNSEIYGPPEMIEEYGRETRRLEAEADSLEVELKALEND